MTTLEEQIECKLKQVQAAKEAWEKLDEELKAMQVKALSESDKPLWERFLKWAEDDVATGESYYLEQFYVNLDTPEGFSDKADLSESLTGYFDYDGKKRPYAAFGYEDIGRGKVIEMQDVILEQWDEWHADLVNGTSNKEWTISMSYTQRAEIEKARGSRLTNEEKTFKTPLTLEHLDQLAEQVMKSNLKSYTYDW